MRVHPLALALIVFGASVHAQTPQTIAADCTTDATAGNGVRHGCESNVSKLTAPDGFVFAEKTLTGGETSGAGSEHSCNLSWGDYMEVIPGTGIQQPRTVTLQAKARGPKGHFAGRGWAKCSYTVNLAKYK